MTRWASASVVAVAIGAAATIWLTPALGLLGIIVSVGAGGGSGLAVAEGARLLEHRRLKREGLGGLAEIKRLSERTHDHAQSRRADALIERARANGWRQTDHPDILLDDFEQRLDQDEKAENEARLELLEGS